ncbi:ATP-binding protein [Brevibacillus formosus]|uniref:ATP-binding protein n=1 Tax=Brevibacillus formosus TaxID=54913 RepID=UPI003F1CFA31
MDTMQVALLQAIPDLATSINSSLDDLNGWNCCIHCRKEIKRMNLELLGKPFRPLPTCKCVVEIEREKQQAQEREERKRRLKTAYSKSIMNDDLVNARLSNFTIRPGTEVAFDKACKYLKTWAESKLGMLMFGQPGNGKSHLLRGIEYELDAAGYATLFLDWPQLTVLAKDSLNKGSKVSLTDIIKSACEVDFLVLDEIGAGALTEFEFKDILFPIVNGRQGKKTGWTTNLDLNRLGNWFLQDRNGKFLDQDGRLLDRILGGCEIVENKGTSKRREDALRRLQG